MVDLKELLTLIYFNNFKDEYLFADVKKLCDFSTSQMKKCIDNLMQKGLLNKTRDGSIEVSIEGLSILENRGILDIGISDLSKDIVTLKFIENPMNLETIYIPEKFKL